MDPEKISVKKNCQCKITVGSGYDAFWLREELPVHPKHLSVELMMLFGSIQ